MFEGKHYVYEVYREMSFSKAAKNLFISQPSLSAAVKKEERAVGFPIFDRSVSPIQLTELGKEYIRACEIILDVENGFQNYVSDMHEMKSGSLSIGGTNFYASYILPHLLSHFTKSYPKIHINLVEEPSAELKDKLLAGSLDLMIDNSDMDPSIFEKHFFCEEQLLLVVPAAFSANEAVRNYAFTPQQIREKQHLSSRIPPVPLTAFAEEPFLLLQPGNDTRLRADRLLRAAGIAPNIRLEPEQQITAYKLARHGMGIAFCGDLLISHVSDSEQLLCYKLDPKEASREVNIYFKRNRYLSKAMQAFLALAEE